jgi:hypothetical protein
MDRVNGPVGPIEVNGEHILGVTPREVQSRAPPAPGHRREDLAGIRHDHSRMPPQPAGDYGNPARRKRKRGVQDISDRCTPQFTLRVPSSPLSTQYRASDHSVFRTMLCPTSHPLSRSMPRCPGREEILSERPRVGAPLVRARRADARGASGRSCGAVSREKFFARAWIFLRPGPAGSDA